MKSTEREVSPGRPGLLTVNQVAEELAISRTKVFDLLARSQLRSLKIGRSRRILASSLDQFIARLVKEGLDTGERPGSDA